MPGGLTQIGRTLIHTPRRAMYAFLWRAHPSEDVLRDASHAPLAQVHVAPTVVSPGKPHAR